MNATNVQNRNSSTVIDIKAEYFPWHVRGLGVLFLVGALAVVTSYWVVAIIFLVVGLVLVSTHSGTEIDPGRKTVREYNSFLFMKTGGSERFSEAEYIFINSGKVSQVMNPAYTANSMTARYVVYNAFLKLDGQKIFLAKRKDKNALVRHVTPAATALDIEIRDTTTVAV